MTPADALRAAAGLVRALAEDAATDPAGRDTRRWEYSPLYPDRGTIHTAGQPTTRILHGASGPGGRGVAPHVHQRHGAYIATMDPAVGAALADWLDSAAEDAEQIGADHHALAVARAITVEKAR